MSETVAIERQSCLRYGMNLGCRQCVEMMPRGYVTVTGTEGALLPYNQLQVGGLRGT